MSLRNRHGDDGVTLVELLVAVILLAAVGLVTTSAVVASHKQYRLADDEARGLADVRTVAERLGRDIRQARSIDPGASQSKLVLWVDHNSDYVRDPLSQPHEIVTWELQSQEGSDGRYNVLRSTAGSDVRIQARTLVSDMAFEYFTIAGGSALSAASGLSTVDAEQVRLVSVQLQYNAVDGSAGDRVTEFTDRLRNVS